jgi:plasmid stabilization system protein ParE
MADMEVKEGLSQAEGYEEPIAETIQRLADLPRAEYERVRKAEAKRLNMRVSVLDCEVNAFRKNDQEENDLAWPVRA